MSSSSDSDISDQVGNVRRMILKSKEGQQEQSANHTYKRRLGDLVFDANFEAGNLGYVEQVDEFEFDLMIRPDLSNPRHRMWFNFTVSNQRPGQSLPLLQEGLTPVVRSQRAPNWVRLHEDQVFYYKSENHSDRFVLSIAFRFSSFEDEHQFALFYPYTYTTLISFVNRWEIELKRMRHLKNTKRALRKSPEPRSSCRSPDDDPSIHPRAKSSLGIRTPNRESKAASQVGEAVRFVANIITRSQLLKPIYLLAIEGLSSRSKPSAIILCRPHGNLDSVASLVCQGLLDFILDDQPTARVARQYVNFVVLPMVDPDSVISGNSCSLITGQTSVGVEQVLGSAHQLHRNFATTRKAIEDICTKNSRVIIIELAVNLNLIGSRVVGVKFEDSLRMERHFALPRALARFADGFYPENCEFSSSTFSSSPFDFTESAHVDQYYLEISPFASYRRSLVERTYQEYDQVRYLALGKSLAYTILELLRPRNAQLPVEVEASLCAFQSNASDIDDLLLRFDNSIN